MILYIPSKGRLSQLGHVYSPTGTDDDECESRRTFQQVWPLLDCREVMMSVHDRSRRKGRGTPAYPVHDLFAVRPSEPTNRSPHNSHSNQLSPPLRVRSTPLLELTYIVVLPLHTFLGILLGDSRTCPRASRVFLGAVGIPAAGLYRKTSREEIGIISKNAIGTYNEDDPRLTLDDDGTQCIVVIPKSRSNVGLEGFRSRFERLVVDRDGRHVVESLIVDRGMSDDGR